MSLGLLTACARAHEGNVANTNAPAPEGGALGDASVASEDAGGLPPVTIADVPETPPACEDTKGITLFVTPQIPWVGAPLRVIAVSERPLAAELRVQEAAPKKSKNEKTEVDPTAKVAASSEARHGGPPYFYVAEVPTPREGGYVVSLSQRPCEAEKNVIALRTEVSKWKPAEPPAPKEGDGLWPIRRNWNRNLENVYSAWIETLFDAPDGEMPSWSALHEVLRDKKRNLLFDYLSGGEDSNNAPVVRPDCADLPYFLRAYFAFKLRLPFGLSECNRGGGGAPPSCRNVTITNEDVPAKTEPSAVKQFGSFLRGTLADKAHSGSARQPFEEPNSDYYPVALTWESLRPGTIFADPYGHVLVVAKRIPQTGERGGQLIAVDGQPDGTIAKKRYWRGNFLYATQRELGGPGWKRFRPVARRGGHLVRLDDDAIRTSPDYGDVSRDAQKLDLEGFYDKMDDVLSPRPLDPQRAMMETLSALEEQVKTRVKSVDNGRKWLETAKSPATMPDGPEIFETSGAWEDFSTPSRDLRILIAMDVVTTLPARVARRPERFAMPKGLTKEQVKSELDKILAKELAARSITYTRSDGSPFTLTLADVVARAPSLEMSYNPNECVESRWGAPAGSAEAKTCTMHAPGEQAARMAEYRAWFRERRRPPRK